MPNFVIIGFIEMEIAILISILTWIPKLTASIHLIVISILKSRIRLAEKRKKEEGEEEHRQLQTVIRFT